MVLYTRKKYNWLNLREKPNYEAISQKNSVFIHQISTLVFSNTDTIILTFFCGLKVVSVYSMYCMLFGMISSIISTFANSVSFAMGQMFNSDRKSFLKLQETYETYFLALSFSLFTVAYIFILPFLQLYTAGITDIDYIDEKVAMFFVVLQILNYGRSTSANIIEYAGHFKKTLWKSILETSINLVVSLISVYYWGIYGVLIGTIVALLYRTNDMIIYANREIMKRSPWPTYKRWILNAILLILCSFIKKFLPIEYSGYLMLFEYAIPVCFIVVFIFLVINSIIEKEARKTMTIYIRQFLLNKKIVKK